jgi:hypothetical protein
MHKKSSSIENAHYSEISIFFSATAHHSTKSSQFEDMRIYTRIKQNVSIRYCPASWARIKENIDNGDNIDSNKDNIDSEDKIDINQIFAENSYFKSNMIK